jgi:hypothetical protein
MKNAVGGTRPRVPLTWGRPGPPIKVEGMGLPPADCE